MERGTVVVTGGAGYIGAHAAEALAAAGFRPVVYDDLSTGRAEAVRWGPLVVGSIGDADRLAALFAAERPLGLLHFAAAISVPESVVDPQRYYRNNVAGSLALFEAARRAGIARIVFSSTAAVYGIPAADRPLTETAPLAPINPYGRTKLAIERVLEDFAAAYGLAAALLRYFNVAGAHAASGLGPLTDPPVQLVPRVLAAAAGRTPPLEVFGDDFPTPDGTAVRDFIHVRDVAEAHVAAFDFLADRRGAHVFNLGCGRGYSVREIIAAAEDVTGRPVPHRIAARRPGDPPSVVADPGKAVRTLGWCARHSSLRKIIADAWDWQCREALPPAHAAKR